MYLAKLLLLDGHLRGDGNRNWNQDSAQCRAYGSGDFACE